MKIVTRAAALGTIGAASLAALPVRAQTTRPHVRLAYGPVDDAAPLFYAAKAGVFAKHGLDLEMVRLTNGAAILAAIAGGSVELGQGTVLALVQGFAKGLPFTVIGNLATFDAARPNFGMLVLLDSAIRAPKDLAGRTIGVVGLQDLLSLSTYAWLDANRVDRSTVKFVEIPASATLAAMEQGRVDASTFYEPFFSANMATGKVRIVGDPVEAVGKHYSTAVLYSSTGWVNGHRDVVDSFLRATQEAALYTATHESEVVPITAEFTGADPAALAKIRHGGRGTVLHASDIQPVIDLAAKYQMIPKAYPATDIMCSCAPRR
jgi:NitT/TauT family transport system substrate-binding protein